MRLCCSCNKATVAIGLYLKYVNCRFPLIVLCMSVCLLSDLLHLQLQIREEWELEQKKQQEAEEEERRKEAERLKKQVCFYLIFICDLF